MKITPLKIVAGFAIVAAVIVMRGLVPSCTATFESAGCSYGFRVADARPHRLRGYFLKLGSRHMRNCEPLPLVTSAGASQR